MRGSAVFRTGIAPGGALAGPWVRDPLWTRARAVPSLDLRFADNKSLVDAVTGASLVTFTRASSGTFVGSDGVIKTAVTNLLLRSEEFDNASWSKTACSVAANTTTAPNGTLTADTLTEDSTLNQHLLSITATATITVGSVYTLSCYVKNAVGTRKVFLTAFGEGYSVFDPVTGNIVQAGGNTCSALSIGNDWWRFNVAFTKTNTNAGFFIGTWSTTNNYTGDGTSGLFLWGAQVEQSSTVGEYIPTTSVINSAPRFDHNPTTGESLGLLVEEARTNSIRNNTMVGAVAGTPGTSPTNWGVATSNAELTSQIVGVGSESGISYIDIKISGTVTASRDLDIRLETLLGVSASFGQTWTQSVYLREVGGSQSNIAAIYLQANTYTAVGTYVTTPWFSAVTVGSGSLITQRLTATAVLLGATTAYIAPFIKISTATTGAVDFTLRIGLPQLEQGAFATSVIPTTTATVTRAADVASITGSAFTSFYNQTEGTVYGEGALLATATGPVFVMRDPTAINRHQIGLSSAAIVTGNVVEASFSVAYTAQTKSSFAYALNNAAFTNNLTALQTDTSCLMPTGVITASIGRFDFGGLQSHNGTIKRLTYWPTRLANTTLQRITQ